MKISKIVCTKKNKTGKRIVMSNVTIDFLKVHSRDLGECFCNLVRFVALDWFTFLLFDFEYTWGYYNWMITESWYNIQNVVTVAAVYFLINCLLPLSSTVYIKQSGAHRLRVPVWGFWELLETIYPEWNFLDIMLHEVQKLLRPGFCDLDCFAGSEGDWNLLETRWDSVDG